MYKKAYVFWNAINPQPVIFTQHAQFTFNIKGVVCRYCYDVKPFNLTACFIMKCDTSVIITRSKMEGHEQQCTIMYKLQWYLSWHTMSVLIGEKIFIHSRIVKLNAQSETFAYMLAMGHHWQCTLKYTFIDVQQTIYNKWQHKLK